MLTLKRTKATYNGNLSKSFSCYLYFEVTLRALMYEHIPVPN
jgi:hypothetical protein